MKPPKPLTTLLALSAFLSACVTMTPQGSKVMLHQTNSTQLGDCKKLGPVTARASAWGQFSLEDLRQQALNNLRDATATAFPEADSVGLANVDMTNSEAVASGIAYRCFEGS